MLLDLVPHYLKGNKVFERESSVQSNLEQETNKENSDWLLEQIWSRSSWNSIKLVRTELILIKILWVFVSISVHF